MEAVNNNLQKNFSPTDIVFDRVNKNLLIRKGKKSFAIVGTKPMDPIPIVGKIEMTLPSGFLISYKMLSPRHSLSAPQSIKSISKHKPYAVDPF